MPEKGVKISAWMAERARGADTLARLWQFHLYAGFAPKLLPYPDALSAGQMIYPTFSHRSKVGCRIDTIIV